MSAKKNHFALNYDGKTLMIHINGKPVVALPKRELGRNVLEGFFLRIHLLILNPDDKQSFEDMAVGFQIATHGLCTLCGRDANLLSGVCYTCSQNCETYQA
jgi:hypothetical protein